MNQVQIEPNVSVMILEGLKMTNCLDVTCDFWNILEVKRARMSKIFEKLP